MDIIIGVIPVVELTYLKFKGLLDGLEDELSEEMLEFLKYLLREGLISIDLYLSLIVILYIFYYIIRTRGDNGPHNIHIVPLKIQLRDGSFTLGICDLNDLSGRYLQRLFQGTDMLPIVVRSSIRHGLRSVEVRHPIGLTIPLETVVCLSRFIPLANNGPRVLRVGESFLNGVPRIHYDILGRGPRFWTWVMLHYCYGWRVYTGYSPFTCPVIPSVSEIMIFRTMDIYLNFYSVEL